MSPQINSAVFDCDQVMSLMDQFIDCELADDVVQSIENHINRCAKCQAHADLEYTLKSSIQRCCQSDVAPDSVRTRVINALESSRLEWISTVVVTQSISIEIREID